MDDKNQYPDNGHGQRTGGVEGEPLGANTEVGRKLKRYYDELVVPEIPDRFKQLLRDLEQNEKQAIAGKESS